MCQEIKRLLESYILIKLNNVYTNLKGSEYVAEKGWIKTYRKIQDCWIWLEKEPFDKRSAWIDLLLTANHSDVRIRFNGDFITVEKGQILTSIRTLAEKWRWSVDKVSRFLKLIESDGMIKKDSVRLSIIANLTLSLLYDRRKICNK